MDVEPVLKSGVQGDAVPALQADGRWMEDRGNRQDCIQAQKIGAVQRFGDQRLECRRL